MALGHTKIPTTLVFGLYVGIDDYPEGLRLFGCANDADLLAETFNPIAAEGTVLVDGQATRRAVLASLEDLIDSAAAASGYDPLLVVYVGGHALVKYNTTFILPYDVDTKRLLSTGFPFRFVTEALASVDVPSLIILDVCRSGTLGLEAVGNAHARQAEQSIMMSALPDQMAVEREFGSKRHGVFTFHLAQALSRAIAGDATQGTSLRDAFDTAYTAMKEESRRQTPSFFGTLSDVALGPTIA